MNTRPILKPWVKSVSLALIVSFYIFRTINLCLQVRCELLLRNNKPLEHERTCQIKQVKVLELFALGREIQLSLNTKRWPTLAIAAPISFTFFQIVCSSYYYLRWELIKDALHLMWQAFDSWSQCFCCEAFNVSVPEVNFPFSIMEAW